MKLFAFLSIADCSVWIHPEVRAANRALGIPMEDPPGVCFIRCTVEYSKEDYRCNKHEYGTPEYDMCVEYAYNNWYQCVTARVTR